MTNANTKSPNSADASEEMHAVLVPGFWLGGWAWQDVEPPLQAAGITTHAVTLPGLDGQRTDGVTLDDHIDSVASLIEGLNGEIVLVGHSGGAAVVQGVIDRRPDRVRRVVYVDSGPLLDGVALMPNAASDVALPTWDELAEQHNSVEGIDDAGLARFRQLAVDEPAGVARSTIRVTNDQRHEVPVSVICTSLSSEALTQMIESGAMPSELGSVRDVRYVDLPTGHWPMFSRPTDLADVLRQEILDDHQTPADSNR